MFARTISALAAVGLTVATLALATPLRAQSVEQEEVAVRIGDLDLTSKSGVERFDRRVRAAARQICGPVPVADLNIQRQVAECHDEVIASARTGLELARASTVPQRSVALAGR